MTSGGRRGQKVEGRGNDLDAAREHWQQSAPLSHQFKDSSYIDVECKVFLVRLKLAEGDMAGASATMIEAEELRSQHSSVYQLPELAGVQVFTLLQNMANFLCRSRRVLAPQIVKYDADSCYSLF